MTHTSNLSLPQWDRTDRIMMDDFNSAMANIDSAVNGRFGPIELISETTVAADAQNLQINMGDIDWDNWSFVILELRREGVSPDLTSKMITTLNGVTLKGSINGNAGHGTAGPRLLIFTPLRNSANKFHCIHLPVPDILYSESSTYADLTSIVFTSAAQTNAGSTVSIYGIR